MPEYSTGPNALVGMPTVTTVDRRDSLRRRETSWSSFSIQDLIVGPNRNPHALPSYWSQEPAEPTLISHNRVAFNVVPGVAELWEMSVGSAMVQLVFYAGMVVSVIILLWEFGRFARPIRGDTQRCAHCGYDMRGLTTEVCPECGGDQAGTALQERFVNVARWRLSIALFGAVTPWVTVRSFRAVVHWSVWDDLMDRFSFIADTDAMLVMVWLVVIPIFIGFHAFVTIWILNSKRHRTRLSTTLAVLVLIAFIDQWVAYTFLLSVMLRG